MVVLDCGGSDTALASVRILTAVAMPPLWLDGVWHPSIGGSALPGRANLRLALPCQAGQSEIGVPRESGGMATAVKKSPTRRAGGLIFSETCAAVLRVVGIWKLRGKLKGWDSTLRGSDRRDEGGAAGGIAVQPRTPFPRREASFLPGEVSLLRRKVRLLRGKVSLLRDKVSLLRGKVSLLRGKVSLLRGKVSLLRDKVSLLRDKVSLLRDKVSLLRGKVSLLRDKVSLLRGKVSFLHHQVSFLRRKVRLLRGREGSLQRGGNRLDNEISPATTRR